ncbi:hypothetical protein S245_012321 [Arachis hypogaea]|nr:DNA repair protein like [Arachis hypogaea]
MYWVYILCNMLAPHVAYVLYLFFVTVTINMSNFMAPLTFLQSFWTPFALLITNFFYPSTMTSAYSCFSDDQPVTSNCENSSLYVLEWLLPRIGFLDKIIVKDVRTLCVNLDFNF